MQRISTLELERRKPQKAGDMSRLQTIEKTLDLESFKCWYNCRYHGSACSVPSRCTKQHFC